MDHMPPDWRQVGWLAGRHGEGNSERMMPTRAARDAYRIGYKEGVTERRAAESAASNATMGKNLP